MVGLLAFGQEEAVFSSDKDKAWFQIEELHEHGAIVVRLKESKRKIDAYINAGMPEKAAEVKADRDAKNKEIVAAFADFDFCPVYFIMASDYQAVVGRDADGFLLDENLVPDTTAFLIENFLLFCDHGPVYEQALSDQNDAKTKYATSTPVQQDALVLKDENMNQLLDPFPFFVSVRLKGFEKAAEKLNNQLKDYLLKVRTKKANE